MGTTARKKITRIKKSIKKTPLQHAKNTQEEFKIRQTETLVIAFCGPVGSGTSTVADIFKDKLVKDYKYEYKKIKLSVLIEKLMKLNDINVDMGHIIPPNMGKKAKNIIELQEGGNTLREMSSEDILSHVAIREIALDHAERTHSKPDKLVAESHRTVYIIDSLKHPEEVNLLRLVFADMFYLVGVICTKAKRQSRLIKKKKISKTDAPLIIERDEGQESNHQQHLRDTLQYSDFFVRNNGDDKQGPKTQVERFLKLLYGQEVIPPTSEEYSMHIAHSAAVRSSCFSRQVGAAITNEYGDIIATGYNDVPKAGGGLYKYEDQLNGRNYSCFSDRYGICNNYSQKEDIKNIINEIVLEDDLFKEKKAREITDKIFKETGIKDLIEFSRAVHAEMEAIISVARSTNATTKGSSLYTTTFPCHNCARHIVDAGIKEVIYIEPYEKSLASEHHDDSIAFLDDQISADDQSEKVIFKHFQGVAPRLFISIFNRNNKIKQDGIIKTEDPTKAKPVIKQLLDKPLDYMSKIMEKLDEQDSIKIS